MNVKFNRGMNIKLRYNPSGILLGAPSAHHYHSHSSTFYSAFHVEHMLQTYDKIKFN